MTMKLNRLISVLSTNYEAGVPTFVRGKPGIGKTETIQAFCQRMTQQYEGFKLWQFYAPTMSPMDIQASAPNYDKGVLQMYNNEFLPNAYTDPDAKGVIFLGELPNTDPATSKLLQKYINGEDMSGVLRKPKGVMVIADGNRIEDKSGVQQQGRAFMSRFEHLEVYSDAEDNTKFAFEHNWHPTVLAFFKDTPDLIDNYDSVFQTNAKEQAKAGNARDVLSEEGRLGIWANMRSWKRISDKETVAERHGERLSLDELAGSLGAGVAAKYQAYKDILHRLASYDEVIKNPAKVDIPTKQDERYALCMLVALRAKFADMDAAFTFGRRMPAELQVVILTNLVQRKAPAGEKRFHEHPAYLKWIADPEMSVLISGGK